MLASLFTKIREAISGGKPDRYVETRIAKSQRADKSDTPLPVLTDGGAAPHPDPPEFRFEAEMPAETYFLQNSGESVIGGFDPLGTKPISFIEAQWEIDVTDDLTGDDAAGRAGVSLASLSELRSSVKRIRTVADRQRLLSPKSAMALAKLETGKAKLTDSDANALEYLLGRLQDDKGISLHVALLADHLMRTR